MRFLVIASLVALCLSCASTFEQFPYSARLVDVGSGRFLSGKVVQKRDDGAVLFLCDDRSWGDHGYYWFDPDNPHGKRLTREPLDSPVSARFRGAPQ
jgi:hypothetical protein